MAHNPLHQFELTKLIDVKLFNYDLSFTISSLFMLLALMLIITFFVIALRNRSFIPSRLQACAEILYDIPHSTVIGGVGPKGERFVPLIFSLFIFILTCNLLGMLLVILSENYTLLLKLLLDHWVAI